MTDRKKKQRDLNAAGLVHVKEWVSQEDAETVKQMAAKVAPVVKEYDQGAK